MEDYIGGLHRWVRASSARHAACRCPDIYVNGRTSATAKLFTAKLFTAKLFTASPLLTMSALLAAFALSTDFATAAALLTMSFSSREMIVIIRAVGAVVQLPIRHRVGQRRQVIRQRSSRGKIGRVGDVASSTALTSP